MRPIQPIDLDTLSEKSHFENIVWVTEGIGMGLHKLMRVKWDYSIPLIQQLYATLVIKKNDDCTTKWMTRSSPSS